MSESDDAQYLASLTPEEVMIIRNANKGVTDPSQIAFFGRRGDANARERKAREREAEVVEAARMALAAQKGRP